MAEALLSIFDMSKGVTKFKISGGQTQGNVVVPEEKHFTEPDKLVRRPKGTEYAREYKQQEEKNTFRMAEKATASFLRGSEDMSGVDDLTSMGASTVVEARPDIYKRYDFDNRSQGLSLPIVRFKTKITEMIASNQTTIIKGATGCGKSTQVPQYILDFCREHDAPCNIIVTQPRRIAAISVAKRVCEERNWEIGSVVGYQVGLDTKHISEDTALTFCTTGVLLQVLVNEKNMNRYTHVIIDEVHERSQDMDFVLIIIKKFLRLSSPGVKVILMSATINVQQFSTYLTMYVPGITKVRAIPAPVIDLDNHENSIKNHKTLHFYLDALDNKLRCQVPQIRLLEPGITMEGFKVSVNLICEFDRMEASHKSRRGAVLVFLPGINEIEELFKLLSFENDCHRLKWWIKPLHSTLTTEEQSAVFLSPPEKHRKIILATNIAESSITVPDIAYVVDYCLTKHLICDLHTNFSSLQLSWASKANCIQRAGRTGRVCDGRVFRLVPKAFFQEKLDDEATPEMLRGPLERVVLLTKLLNMGEPKAILGLSLDPPDIAAIEQSILQLKEKGALLPKLNGQFCLTDGDITFLGHVMSKLPVDPSVAKFILLGHVFSCLNDCVIMAAAMTLKSMFSAPFLERLSAYHNRLSWADGSCSDLVSFLNAYNVWRHQIHNGYFQRSSGDGEEGWARRNYIQIRALHEVHLLVLDLTKRLHALGIEESRGTGRIIWSPQEKPFVLKIVIAGAFYPHYFARGEQGGQVDEKEAIKKLHGHDPFSTVYLQGMPTNQPKKLYSQSIKEALGTCAQEMMIAYDHSSKVYVQFAAVSYPGIKVEWNLYRNEIRQFVPIIPGKVMMGVYRAVKMRQLNLPIVIPMLTPDDAKRRAEKIGLSTEMVWSFDRQPATSKFENFSKPMLPCFNESFLNIVITHSVDVGHFWAQHLDSYTVDQQSWLNEKLKNDKYLVTIKGLPILGNIYAAPFKDEAGLNYYRAKVLSVSKAKDNKRVEVLFIDYGNSIILDLDYLLDFGPELLEQGVMRVSHLAFECMLAKLQPSLLENPHGTWNPIAQYKFDMKMRGAKIYGKIYSVFGGVVYLELITQRVENNQEVQCNINEWLIQTGLGQPAEESYFSQENHLKREAGLQLSDQKHYEELQQSTWVTQNDVESPSPRECPLQVTLRGPISPLEMKVYPTTQIATRKEVSIEQSSVNSVLLDTNPQDPHERLLVAAVVGQSTSGGKITLRHTTLMPNIQGLPALMCLIFAPEVELRTNKDRTRLTGALCGLGLNPATNEAAFPDHDIEVTFDTNITQIDIEQINKVRFWMNRCFVTDDQNCLSEDNSDILRAQERVKFYIFSLFKRNRASTGLEMASQPFVWNLIDPEHVIKVSSQSDLMVGVFRYHWVIKLRLLPAEKKNFESRLAMFDDMCQYVEKGEELHKWVTCNVCNFSVGDINSLKLHLESTKHKEFEQMMRERLLQDEAEEDYDFVD